ncbi:hypothetical protein [Pseudomonas sp. Marseille-Q7302]
MPVLSQEAWCRQAAEDKPPVMPSVESLDELRRLRKKQDVTQVWVSSAEYVTRDVWKSIDPHSLKVASLPGLEGDELRQACSWVLLHTEQSRKLAEKVKTFNAHHAYSKNQADAEVATKRLENVLRELYAQPGQNLSSIALELQNRKIKTPRGGDSWHATQVRRQLVNLGLIKG